MTCDRCGKDSLAYTMSIFNTDEICMACKDKERAHPAFEEARRVESEQVKAGNFNFQGVGLPADLR
jgi:hypothetical protein